MGAKKGGKRFSISTMEMEERFYVSKEMNKIVNERIRNLGITKSAYYRNLIMNDNNIDELGRSTK